MFFYYLILFLLSLLMGNFLNKVIDRLPLLLQQQWQQEARFVLNMPDEIGKTKTIKWFLARSHCLNCQQKFTLWQAVTLFSYSFLKGKCCNCQQAINKRYFLVEALSVLLSLFTVSHFGITLPTVFALFFIWALIALVWIDLEHLILPDHITLTLLWLGLLINLNNLFTDINSAVVGASAGYVFLGSIAWIFKKLTKKTGMGQGDFKLFAAFGAWFGWQLLPHILLIAAVTGTIVSMILIFLKKQQRNKAIPFGPYLALAGWCVLLWKPFFFSV